MQMMSKSDLMSKSDHIHEEKKQFENQVKLVRLLQRTDQLPHKKLLSTSQIWTWFLQFKYWKTHQLCVRRRNFGELHGFSSEWKEPITHNATHDRTIHHKSVFVNRKSYLEIESSQVPGKSENGFFQIGLNH